MKRILTGDRTTGKLHLGHYVGSLKNRVKLQHDYETFVLLADVQALTTHFKRPELIRESIYQVALDNLAVGLDPEKIVFIQQSQVKAIAELTVLYSMVVTVNSLRHNPTIKSEIKQYGYNDISYGFLGYPVSQAADITFCDTDLVPVGDDQLPHLEQTRKIARRFNDLYSPNKRIIKEPTHLLSDTPRLIGLDGNAKMGKSLGNAIYLADEDKIIKDKVMSAVTDPNRISLSDKGNPDICTVAKYHKAFNVVDYNNICNMCKSADIGCVTCKRQLIGTILSTLAPVKDRRKYFEQRLKQVKDYIITGTSKANKIGNKKLELVKQEMNINL